MLFALWRTRTSLPAAQKYNGELIGRLPKATAIQSSSNIQSHRTPALLRPLVSTWTGVALIGLIVAYLSIASILEAKAPLTLQRLGIDPQHAYGHWLPVALASLLCLNLLAASAVRIPLDLPRAGAWLSHLGVLVLAAGVVVYATQRQEGQLVAEMRDGRSPVLDSFRSSDRTSLYLMLHNHAPDEPLADSVAQIPLPPLPSAGRTRLNVSIASDGLVARAVEYVADAALEMEVRDDGATPMPGVRMTVDQGGRTREVFLLGQEGADSQQVGGVVFGIRAARAAELDEALATRQPWEGGYDAAVVVMLDPADGGGAKLLVYRRGQLPRAMPLEAGKATSLDTGDGELTLDVQQLLTRAAIHFAPRSAGSAAGRLGLDGPAVAVEVAQGGWKTTEWLPLTGAGPLPVALPDGRELELSAGPSRLGLGATVEIVQAHAEWYGGTTSSGRMPRDYICTLRIDGTRQATLRLNEPVQVGRYRISQGSWLPSADNPRAIVLLVASRPGIGIIYTGLAMVAAGFPWALWVKPWLLRRRAALREPAA